GRSMAKNIPGSPVRLCPKEPGASFRTGWTQGLWICAVGLPATIVFAAHKVATTVCPPPPSDSSCGPSKSDDTDLDTTAGCHSAGAQIYLAVIGCLYAPKCGRVLINLPDSTGVVFNVEAADGLPS